MTGWELLKRYAAACAPLLGRGCEVDEGDRTIHLGEAWVAQEMISGGGGEPEWVEDSWVLGTTVHDPGVRYHSDGSGTPPSEEDVELGECEELGIGPGGVLRGDPHDAVRSLVLWHLRERLDDALCDAAMVMDLEEMRRDEPAATDLGEVEQRLGEEEPT